MGLRGLSGRALATLVVLLTVGAASASAATLTVTTTQDEITAGDHQCSLREAIAAVDAPGTSTDCGTAANAGNTIVLGPTTYTLSKIRNGTDDNTSGDLDVHGTTGLTIAGAGVGVTTVSGSTALKDRLLDVLNGGVTLQNLTLTGGHAPDGADGVSTGTSGMAATPGQSGSDGGAISNSGSLSLDHVAITNNSAGTGGRGGGGEGGTAFSDGAGGGSGGRGGGIYNASAASLALRDATISANRSGTGGVGGFGGSGTSPVGSGGAGGYSGDGGGIYNAGGTVTVTDSTLAQNIAGDGGAGGAGGNPFSGSPGNGGTGQGGASGGAIATTGGTVSITNSTITGNVSGQGGDGGAAGFNAPPLVQGTGGHAGNGSGGGGIFAPGGTVTLTNLTIAQNQSGRPGTPGTGSPSGGPGTPAQAAGVFVNSATVTARDTLLASNSVGNCGGPTAVTDGHNNLSFAGGGCPSGFLNGDPLLGPLQDNGGPTQTMGLGAGSAAIDKGAGCPSTDQRGAPRPSGPACDIGAYEATPPAATTGAASSVTSSGATLNGSVTPNHSSTSVRFEYGTSTAYGSTTPSQQFGGFSPSSVSVQIAGLIPHTIYHYRVIATSPDGTATGSDQTFTTAPAPPATTAPKLTGLSVKPTSFRTAKRKHHPRDKTGTKLGYTDSQAAITTFTVFKCTKVKKHRCARYRKLGSFRHTDSAGRNSFHWNGKLGRTRLKPGRYRLTANARSRGLVSRPLNATFRVVS